jgi:hypothetical protein
MFVCIDETVARLENSNEDKGFDDFIDDVKEKLKRAASLLSMDLRSIQSSRVLKATDFALSKEKYVPSNAQPIEVWAKNAKRNLMDFMKNGGNAAAIFSNLFEKNLPTTFVKAMATKYGDRTQDATLVHTYMTEAEEMFKGATSKSEAATKLFAISAKNNMKPHEVERRIQAQYSFHLEFEQLSENAGISLKNSDPMIEQRYLKCVDLRDPSRGDLWHPLLEKIRETVTSETGSHKVADIHDLIISALKSRLPEQAYGKYHDEPIGAPGGGAGPSNGRGRAGGSRPRDEKRVQFSDKSKYRRTEGGRGRGNSGGGGRELPAKTRWVPSNSETPLLTSGEHADQGCRLYHHQSPTQPGKSSHRNR